MADKAEAYVGNKFPGDINITRQFHDDGSNSDITDLKITIPKSTGKKIHQERIDLPGPEVSLVINAPEGVDTKGYYLNVRADVDLEVKYSRTHSNWTIKILPNELDAEVPTTVNVNVGEEGP
jgi:hypothetical protein